MARKREYEETEYDLDMIDLDDEETREEARKRAEKEAYRNMTREEKKAYKQEKKKKRSVNREFAVVTYIFVAMFVLLMGYFAYFMFQDSYEFSNSTYNPRLSALSDKVVRGKIMTSDGIVVAKTETDDEGNEVRSYPYKNMYAHAVGYNINGKGGVELDANYDLLTSHQLIFEQIRNDILGQKNQGDSVVLTLDSKVQDAAYYGLSVYNGAVIALDPETGQILAMVSKPDFDPNTLSKDWDYYTSDSSSSNLLNRCTQGLYPPGSTFKIVTALEYLNEGASAFEKFDCQGKYTYDDKTIHCYEGEVHGEQTFIEAFANSCNCAFAQIGLKIDRDQMNSLCSSLLFNTKLPTKLSNVKKSSFSLSDDDPASTVMETAIGQGQTLVSPLHMAMIVSAIANNGVLMEPYMIDHIQNYDNFIVSKNKPEEYGQILTEDQASVMQTYLNYVVTNGTCRKLNNDTYTAYGKTGTAEYNSNKEEAHSWFVGYAEKDGKKIVVAVIMEGAGSGSSHAVPLAKDIFDTYFAED